jgi:hypothetical protein
MDAELYDVVALAIRVGLENPKTATTREAIYLMSYAVPNSDFVAKINVVPLVTLFCTSYDRLRIEEKQIASIIVANIFAYLNQETLFAVFEIPSFLECVAEVMYVDDIQAVFAMSNAVRRLEIEFPPLLEYLLSHPFVQEPFAELTESAGEFGDPNADNLRELYDKFVSNMMGNEEL